MAYRIGSERCHSCDGDGRVVFSENCPKCDGQGTYETFFRGKLKICSKCNGNGEVYFTKRCESCNGRGYVDVKEEYCEDCGNIPSECDCYYDDEYDY